MLDFIGRADQQVKLRGFRIEPGEIEAALVQHPAVAQAVVIAREDRARRQAACGLCRRCGGRRVDAAALRAHLAASLPDYMVPSAFVVLERLPLTPNGKLDRKALPAPDLTPCRCAACAAHAAGGDSVPRCSPRCSASQRVGIDDNFFELGGHSLLATRLISRIRGTLGCRGRDPHSVRGADRRGAGASGCTRRRPRGLRLCPMPRPAEMPLSFAQRRLWFLHRLEGPSATYNIPMARAAEGALDQAALEAALGDVVERHESLRTIFPDTLGVPRQQILDRAAARPRSGDCVCQRSEPCRELCAAAARRGFDLASEPAAAGASVCAWRQRACAAAAAAPHCERRLVAGAAVARSGSGPMRRGVQGQAPASAGLPVQYADYTLWQHEVLGREERSATAPSRGSSRSGPRRSRIFPIRLSCRPTGRGLRCRAIAATAFALHIERGRCTAALLALARDSQASLFMVLQAGLAALLTRLGAGTDIPIGSPIAGRTDSALDDLVGFFVNTLVLRTDTSGNPSLRDLIARVRADNLAAYGHQDLPFERLVEVLNPARSLARHPLFQVMLALQNNAQVEPRSAGAERHAWKRSTPPATQV